MLSRLKRFIDRVSYGRIGPEGPGGPPGLCGVDGYSPKIYFITTKLPRMPDESVLRTVNGLVSVKSNDVCINPAGKTFTRVDGRWESGITITPSEVK